MQASACPASAAALRVDAGETGRLEASRIRLEVPLTAYVAPALDAQRDSALRALDGASRAVPPRSRSREQKYSKVRKSSCSRKGVPQKPPHRAPYLETVSCKDQQRAGAVPVPGRTPSILGT